MAGGAIANLSASLRWDIDDFQRGTASIEGAFQSIIGIAGDMANAVAAAGRKMTLGMTLPLAGIAALTTKAASDAAELQSAFDFTFGSMAGTMNRWAEQSGDAMGRSTQQMQEGAFALGGLFQAAAPTEQAAARLSQRFTELAVDAGSFFNVPFDEALGRIRSGLAGESEPLRRFNIFINEAAVNTKALELGLITAGQELDENGKIMARQALIMEGLSAANGDAERTSGGLANQVERLKSQMQELSTEIGEILAPYAQKLVGVVTRLVEWFKALPEGVKNAAVGFAVFLAALGPVSIALSALAITILPLFLVGMGPVFAIISAIVNPIGTLVVVLGKLAGGFVGVGGIVSNLFPMLRTLISFLLRAHPVTAALITVFSLFGDKIGDALGKVWDMAQSALGPSFSNLMVSVGGLLENLRESLDAFANSQFGQAIGEIMDWIGKLIAVLVEIAGGAVVVAIDGLITLLTSVAMFISGMVAAVTRLFEGDWQGAWNAAKNAVVNAIENMFPWFTKLYEWIQGALRSIGLLEAKKASMTGGKDIFGMAGDAFKVMRKVQGEWVQSARPEEEKSYAVASVPKAGGPKRPPRARTTRTRGSTGPTAQELQERREALRLQQAMEVAREKGDIEGLRALERQRDLKGKIDQYERAGLANAQAKIAAEKDLAELDAVRAHAREEYLREQLIEVEYQVARIEGDERHLEYLDDEKQMEADIKALREKGYDLAVAESIAAAHLLSIEEARSRVAGDRLADQERAHQMELADLRGDQGIADRMREEERIAQRERELRVDGRLPPADAHDQAMREAAERSQAHLQGTWRDAFRNGLRAAMDGNLGKFFQDWLHDRAFNALSRVLDKLADNLANLFTGQQQGGGGFLGGLLGTIFGGGGGGFSPGSSGFDIDAALAASRPPGFSTGGSFRIAGNGGIDRNLLSLNGNPIARVSSGEIMDIRKGEAGGGGVLAQFAPAQITISADGADPAQLRRLENEVRALNDNLEQRAIKSVTELNQRTYGAAFAV